MSGKKSAIVRKKSSRRTSNAQPPAINIKSFKLPSNYDPSRHKIWTIRLPADLDDHMLDNATVDLSSSKIKLDCKDEYLLQPGQPNDNANFCILLPERIRVQGESQEDDKDEEKLKTYLVPMFTSNGQTRGKKKDDKLEQSKRTREEYEQAADSDSDSSSTVYVVNNDDDFGGNNDGERADNDVEMNTNDNEINNNVENGKSSNHVSTVSIPHYNIVRNVNVTTKTSNNNNNDDKIDVKLPDYRHAYAPVAQKSNLQRRWRPIGCKILASTTNVTPTITSEKATTTSTATSTSDKATKTSKVSSVANVQDKKDKKRSNKASKDAAATTATEDLVMEIDNTDKNDDTISNHVKRGANDKPVPLDKKIVKSIRKRNNNGDIVADEDDTSVNYNLDKGNRVNTLMESLAQAQDGVTDPPVDKDETVEHTSMSVDKSDALNKQSGIAPDDAVVKKTAQQPPIKQENGNARPVDSNGKRKKVKTEESKESRHEQKEAKRLRKEARDAKRAAKKIKSEKK